METKELLDISWILTCSAMVFLMQAGFCCLETGLVRAKNSINVAMKNLVDFLVSGFGFWMVGFVFVFGDSFYGVIGIVSPVLDSPKAFAFFLFQLTFCGAATTIVSGAVAERMRFTGYLAIAIFVSVVIYPISAHWVWGGALTGEATGWLAKAGFIDFAGSTVVHAVGGCLGLVACWIIGARKGRFNEDGSQTLFSHNIPIATIGVMLLWFGWFGFNGGSTLELNGSVPSIITNTTLAGIAGGLAALVFSQITYRHSDVTEVLNGVLAGLVSVTAGCHVIGMSGAICIGLIGGVITSSCGRLLESWKIDDAVGAFSVHGAAGIWGTVAVALFGNPMEWGTGNTRWQQFQIQATGTTACCAFALIGGWCGFKLINCFIRLRVTEEEEEMGLNVAEHQAYTELYDLIGQMDEHSQTGDFSRRVSLESDSEVGQIAKQYNQVLRTVHVEHEMLLEASQRVAESNASLEATQHVLKTKVDELEEFNDVAVGREIRMIDLKREINELLQTTGNESKYDVSFSRQQQTSDCLAGDQS
jgi:ammonium transporter, Amt family